MSEPMFLGVLTWEALKLGPAVYSPHVWKNTLAECWPQIEEYVDAQRAEAKRQRAALRIRDQAYLTVQGEWEKERETLEAEAERLRAALTKAEDAHRRYYHGAREPEPGCVCIEMRSALAGTEAKSDQMRHR